MLELAQIARNEETKPRLPSAAPQLVYNLCNPRLFSWPRDVLPALRAAGLAFEAVPWGVWLKRMRGGEFDAEKNPSIKLLGFWEKKGDGGCTEQGIGVTEGEDIIAGIGGVRFDTRAAERDSVAVRSAPDIVAAGVFERLVREGIKD